jgi:hypothetical protein
VDELMARYFLDPRMHVALKVLCPVCGRGIAAECADLEREGKPFSRMEFALPERPPAVLWSRSGSRGVWTAAGAVLSVENTHANLPEEAAREALGRLRDHAPMTGIFLWGSDPHREAEETRYGHSDGDVTVRPGSGGMADLAEVPARTSTAALLGHAFDAVSTLFDGGAKPLGPELFGSDPLAWARRWAGSGEAGVRRSMQALFRRLLVEGGDAQGAGEVRRAAGIARREYLEGMAGRDPERVNAGVALASGAGLALLGFAVTADEPARLGAVTPDGFVGLDAEGDHEAWEFQRDIGLVADLLPVGCGGLLEVLGAVYSPSLAGEEFSGEMSKELPARGLVPPEKPRVVKAGEAEIRVIPGARPGMAVFVVVRKDEFTLLALEEGRWVMGDGWSMEKVVRAFGNVGT